MTEKIPYHKTEKGKEAARRYREKKKLEKQKNKEVEQIKSKPLNTSDTDINELIVQRHALIAKEQHITETEKAELEKINEKIKQKTTEILENKKKQMENKNAKSTV